MHGKRVLVIDDDDSVREVAQVSLQVIGGWDVLTASSAVDGLAIAAAEHPDVILLDVMMPDMDGPAALKLLQSDPATGDIPVLFLTAKTQATEQRRLTSLGPRAVLTKPFDPMRLSDDVNAALGWAT